jgi:hypothetical protein
MLNICFTHVRTITKQIKFQITALKCTYMVLKTCTLAGFEPMISFPEDGSDNRLYIQTFGYTVFGNLQRLPIMKNGILFFYFLIILNH